MLSFEAFILVGGASSRMQTDKANLKIGGKTFTEMIAAEIQLNSPDKISLVGKNAEIDDFPIVSDIFISEKKAAIIGIHSAIFHAKTEWILICACDLPFVSREFFAKLLSFCTKNIEAIIPIQPDGKFQPLCAVYRKSCFSKIEETLQSKDWSLRNMLERLQVKFVEFSEVSQFSNSEKFFMNINTPEDFVQIAQIGVEDK